VAINRQTLAIEAELNRYLAGVTDQQTRALVEAWSLAWDQVAHEIDAAALDLVNAAGEGRVTRTMVLRSQRAQAALDVLGGTLDTVAAQAGFTINADLTDVITAATQAEVDMIASQLTGTRRAELRANLVRADPGQIAAMVERATQRITSLTRPLGAEATAAVRRELLRGIAVGTNPRVAARRMVRGIEDQFLGGLNRALVISRTELLDATRAAQQATDQANTDVLAGWAWVAHLGPRTCRSCIAQHGTIHPIDEPGPLDHQQGRCARVPRTKTWAELGFEGIEDPPDSTPDAEAWFNSLTADEQRGILGDKGYEAWQRGDYPISAWSTRREADGWRDSFAPSRPPGPGTSATPPTRPVIDWDGATSPSEVGNLIQGKLGSRGRVSGFDSPDVDLDKAKAVGRTIGQLLDDFPEVNTDIAIRKFRAGPGTIARASANSDGLGGYENLSLEILPARMRADDTLTRHIHAAADKGHFHFVGDVDPMEYMVAHEFGHLLDYTTYGTAAGPIKGGATGTEVMRAVLKEQGIASRGAPARAYRAENVSGYGRTSRAEEIAEAFADVRVNGPDAFELSHRTHDELIRRLRSGPR